jgi:transposase
MNVLPVAGIDVGKEFSEMAILYSANKIYDRMKIYHNFFEKVDKAIDLLKKAEKDFANRPIVAMESTGHYHKILFHAFAKAGFEIVITNPLQTDSITGDFLTGRPNKNTSPKHRNRRYNVLQHPTD